jgi:hypothetical protein
MYEQQQKDKTSRQEPRGRSLKKKEKKRGVVVVSCSAIQSTAAAAAAAALSSSSPPDLFHGFVKMRLHVHEMPF